MADDKDKDKEKETNSEKPKKKPEAAPARSHMVLDHCLDSKKKNSENNANENKKK